MSSSGKAPVVISSFRRSRRARPCPGMSGAPTFAGSSGVSLAATLHAEGPEDAFAQICEGSGVPDGDASKIAFTVSLRSIGRWEEPTRRVVASVHEIGGVERGRPKARLLYRWDEARDEFVKVTPDAASGRAGRA